MVWVPMRSVPLCGLVSAGSGGGSHGVVFTFGEGIMSSLTGTISVKARFPLVGTSEFGSPEWLVQLAMALTFANGSAINEANQVWGDQARSLAATTSESLDLAGGLTNGLGETVTFARVKLIIIKLNTLTAGYTLEVGGAASNQFATIFGDVSDKVKVRGGGFLILAAPDATAYAVTAATGDILKINNPNAATITYDIILVGSTA